MKKRTILIAGFSCFTFLAVLLALVFSLIFYFSSSTITLSSTTSKSSPAGAPEIKFQLDKTQALTTVANHWEVKKQLSNIGIRLFFTDEDWYIDRSEKKEMKLLTLVDDVGNDYLKMMCAKPALLKDCSIQNLYISNFPKLSENADSLTLSGLIHLKHVTEWNEKFIDNPKEILDKELEFGNLVFVLKKCSEKECQYSLNYKLPEKYKKWTGKNNIPLETSQILKNKFHELLDTFKVEAISSAGNVVRGSGGSHGSFNYAVNCSTRFYRNSFSKLRIRWPKSIQEVPVNFEIKNIALKGRIAIKPFSKTVNGIERDIHFKLAEESFRNRPSAKAQFAENKLKPSYKVLQPKDITLEEVKCESRYTVSSHEPEGKVNMQSRFNIKLTIPVNQKNIPLLYIPTERGDLQGKVFSVKFDNGSELIPKEWEVLGSNGFYLRYNWYMHMHKTHPSAIIGEFSIDQAPSFNATKISEFTGEIYCRQVDNYRFMKINPSDLVIGSKLKLLPNIELTLNARNADWLTFSVKGGQSGFEKTRKAIVKAGIFQVMDLEIPGLQTSFVNTLRFGNNNTNTIMICIPEGENVPICLAIPCKTKDVRIPFSFKDVNLIK